MWLVVLSLLASACGSEFAPRSEVGYLRVLGIRSDVPTVSPGEIATITALIGTTLPDEMYTLQWEFCAFTQGSDTKRSCAEVEAFPVFEASGPVFTIPYLPMIEPGIKAACENLQLDENDPADRMILESLPEGVQLPTCDREGFPGQIRLTVSSEALEEDFVAVKTLYLRYNKEAVEGVEEQAPNRNPEIISFEIGGNPASVVRGKEYDVRCLMDEETLESFTPVGAPAARGEEILFSWFESGGSLENDLTYYEEGVVELEEAQKNVLTIEDASDDEVDTLTLWCIIRDGRGGTDWRSIVLPIVDASE